MAVDKNKRGDWNGEPGKPYDLTEEASPRGDDSGATNAARKAESDDINEETNLGYMSSPDGDSVGENRVSTSINDN